MKSYKTIDQRNTAWRSDNINDLNNINEPIKISIASHFPDSFKLPQVIYLNSFFTMRSNGSPGYMSCKTIHYYSCRCNNDDDISEEEYIEFFWVNKVTDIGLLIPSNIPQVTVDGMKVLNIGLLIPATLPQVIAEVVAVGQV